MLSIIIPYYNTLKEIKELLSVLEPQLNDNVEVIIVDDGCNEKELEKFNATVIHLPFNSGGASVPRNVGLDVAKGDYITFIDSDDMITNNYIKKITNKIKKNPDIIFISWKGNNHNVLIYEYPPKWNCSVWCRVYKREIIGNTRFREDLKLAEDWAFNQEIKFNSHLSIKEQIYFYNSGREGSLTTGGKK